MSSERQRHDVLHLLTLPRLGPATDEGQPLDHERWTPSSKVTRQRGGGGVLRARSGAFGGGASSRRRGRSVASARALPGQPPFGAGGCGAGGCGAGCSGAGGSGASCSGKRASGSGVGARGGGAGAATGSGCWCGDEPHRGQVHDVPGAVVDLFLLDRHRAYVDDDGAGDVVVPAAALVAGVHRRPSRRARPGRDRTSAARRHRAMSVRSSAGPMPIGVPDPRWTTRSPSSALPGEMPISPSSGRHRDPEHDDGADDQRRCRGRSGLRRRRTSTPRTPRPRSAATR